MLRQRKIFRYLKNFGVFHGIMLFVKIRRSKKKGIISFRLPRLMYPVFIRRDSSDFGVFEEVFIDRQYEPPVQVAEVRSIVDAGANIGIAALWFLQKYPEAFVICIEPEEKNFELLKKNLGGYPNCLLLKKGLWHESVNLQLSNPSADNWAFQLEQANNQDCTIEAISVPQLLSENRLAGIDLFKIDVEGSEKEIFGSDISWAKFVNYFIIEIHENIRPGAYNSVMKLCDLGFKVQQQTAQYFFEKK